MANPLLLTVAIPTYRRDQVLIDTLEHLLRLEGPAFELLVLDQTESHDAVTAARLESLAASGRIRWLRLKHPSVTAAMNRGLLEARGDVVVFVDDDVVPEPQLLDAHVRAHAAAASPTLVAGRVIQPWHEGLAPASLDGLAGLARGEVREFIGCNFSVPRALALEVGGFDENFVRVAYRFEAEFAHRWRTRGHRILFEPSACLHHLKAGQGGTRSWGDHLTTWRPDHAVGAYYFGLRTGAWLEFMARPARSVATRYHLRHPWQIPATLLAEMGGMLWALGLLARGPRTLKPTNRHLP